MRSRCVASGGRLAGAALALLGLACAATSGSDAMRREAEFGAPSEVVDAAATFRASLSLPFTQETDADGIHELEIPIERVPIYCLVWPDRAELGATALRMAGEIFERLRGQGNTISHQQFVSIAAGAIDDAPYQAIHARFLLESEEGQGWGLMKVAAANKQGHGIACNHWNAGYAETFDRAFEELVGSFRAAEPPPEPDYEEIVTIALGDLTLGVLTASWRRDEEGDVQGIAETSMILPVSSYEFTVSYERAIDWSRADGDLINAYLRESDLDEEHTRLSLDWSRERGWYVEGRYKGKAIDATLDHDGGIASGLSELLLARFELAPQGDLWEVSLPRWLPGLDPTRVLDVRFSLDPEDPSRMRSQLEDLIEMEAVRGADGLPESAVMDVGDDTLTFQRIYRRGEF